VGSEYEGASCDLRESFRVIEDGVAKAGKDGEVEGVEDWVLEDDFVDGVFLA